MRNPVSAGGSGGDFLFKQELVNILLPSDILPLSSCEGDGAHGGHTSILVAIEKLPGTRGTIWLLTPQDHAGCSGADGLQIKSTPLQHPALRYLGPSLIYANDIACMNTLLYFTLEVLPTPSITLGGHAVPYLSYTSFSLQCSPYVSLAPTPQPFDPVFTNDFPSPTTSSTGTAFYNLISCLQRLTVTVSVG
ncbi:hypothetical protein E2C01_043388 [Portunus trituberculatus]|uniref:Uncharacterized protein n=1 Tax=Portunus trituberculatus TaxID=210409 RepID=A0A5B7FQ61_PORTR|nr:hypothetical protein [Portunus trituberculatus]